MNLEHISEQLRPLAVAIDELELDPDNARKHPKKSVDAMVESLRQFGQQKPIVLKADGKTVMAGNGTVMAAQVLGWGHLAAVKSALTGAQATAFGLADNRTAENSEWDFEKVAELVKGLQSEEFDINGLGWAGYELEPMLAADWTPAEKGELPEADREAKKADEEKKGEHHIKIPTEQNQTVQAAILKARESLGDAQATEGAAIEHICRWYLEL